MNLETLFWPLLKTFVFGGLAKIYWGAFLFGTAHANNHLTIHLVLALTFTALLIRTWTRRVAQ